MLLIWAVPLCTALAAAALLGMFLLPQFVRSQPMGFGYESILDNLVARVEVVAKIPECDFEEIKIDPTTATRFKSTAGGTSKLRNFLRSRRHSLIYLDHLVIGKTVSWIARSPRKWHQARRISLWEAKREIRATQHPHKYEWVKLYLFWFLYLGILSSLFISVARYASKMDEEEQRPDSEEVSSKDVETITRNAVMNEVRRTRKALDDDLADQSRIDVEEEKNRETGLSIYQRKPNQLGKIAGTYLSYRKFTDSESMVDNRKELIYFGKNGDYYQFIQVMGESSYSELEGGYQADESLIVVEAHPKDFPDQWHGLSIPFTFQNGELIVNWGQFKIAYKKIK